MSGFLGWGQNAHQATGMGMNQLHPMQQQQYNPQAQQQSGNSGFWKGLGNLGAGATALGAATGWTPFGVPLAAIGAGVNAFSHLAGGYADGGSVEDEQHYEEGGSVQPMQGLGSFNPQNDYASTGFSSFGRQPMYGMDYQQQPSQYQDPNQMNNGFSGMTPMYGMDQNANQQNQQFAMGGVATNFGRARGRY